MVTRGVSEIARDTVRVLFIAQTNRFLRQRCRGFDAHAQVADETKTKRRVICGYRMGESPTAKRILRV